MQHPAFVRRTYDEALDLMVEARNYMAFDEALRAVPSDAIDGLRVSCEAMRVTSRLTQVMAWLMMQRAVQDGEIALSEALSDINRLSGEDVCLEQGTGRDFVLPRGLMSLLERSLSLYVRISRIERQMLGASH